MYKTIHFLPLFLLSLLAATSCQSDKPGRLKTISYESCCMIRSWMRVSLRTAPKEPASRTIFWEVPPFGLVGTLECTL